MKSDHVAHILKQWEQERPGLKTNSMGVVGRILRSAHYLQQQLQTVSAQYNLPSGGFDVLASLRRQGSPYQLSPTQLYQELLITSGAITYRLDRLEELSLIERVADPKDRRGMLVRLTQEGRNQIDHLIEEHIEKERNLLSKLSEQKQHDIAQGLAELLTDFEKDLA